MDQNMQQHVSPCSRDKMNQTVWDIGQDVMGSPHITSLWKSIEYLKKMPSYSEDSGESLL